MSNGVVIQIIGKDDTGEVVNAIKRHLDDLKTKAAETSSSMGSIGGAMLGGLQAAGIYIGLQQVVGGFKQMISSSAALGMQMSRLSEMTGISVQTLSSLRYAAQMSGTSFDSFIRGVIHLSQLIWEWQHGLSTARYAFQALGVSQKEMAATGGDLNKVLALLADKLHAMPNGYLKLAGSEEALGRMTKDLLPVLEQGSDGLHRMGLEARDAGVLMDANGTEKMKEMYQASERLHASLQGLGLAMTSLAAPWLEGEAQGMTTFLNDMRSSKWGAWGEMTGAMTAWVSPRLGNYLFNHGNQEIQDAQRKKQAAQSHEADHPKPGAPLDFNLNEKAKKGGSSEARAASMRQQLADSEARLQVARERSLAQEKLAILEAQHHAQLVTDRQYYAQQAAIQQAAYSAERQTMVEQQEALRSQLAAAEKHHGGTPQEQEQQLQRVNDLKRQQIELSQRLLEIDTQHVQKSAELAAQQIEATRRQREAVLSMEAALEEARGKGTSAALAKLKDAGDTQRQSLVAGGATTQQLAEFDALQKIKSAKVQIAALDRQQEQIRLRAKIEEDKVRQQALAGAVSQEQAAQQLNALRQQEAEQLQTLAAQYQQFGQTALQSQAAIADQITQTMQAMQKSSAAANQTLGTYAGEGEKIAHSIFDPMFSASTKWKQDWKTISDGLVSDLGQLMESKLFGYLFGDPQGRGGRGLSGGSYKGNITSPFGQPGATAGGVLGSMLAHMHHGKKASTTPGVASGHMGVLGHLLGHFHHGKKLASPAVPSMTGPGQKQPWGLHGMNELGKLFGHHHKGTQAVSNGGYSKGAGAIPTAASSIMQMAKKGTGGGGVEVIINNTGAPVHAASATSSLISEMEKQVINIMLNQFATNGPVAQASQSISSGMSFA